MFIIFYFQDATGTGQLEGAAASEGVTDLGVEATATGEGILGIVAGVGEGEEEEGIEVGEEGIEVGEEAIEVGEEAIEDLGVEWVEVEVMEEGMRVVVGMT